MTTGAAAALLPLASTQGPVPQWLSVTGMILLSLLAAAAVLAGPPRLRAAAMLTAVVLAPLLLAGEVWDSPQVAALRARPELALPAAAVGLVAVGALARLFARRPAAFAVAAVAALPFRVPIESGGATANLLLPLYVVIGAGVLAWAVPRLRFGAAPAEGDRRAGWLEWLLVGFVVLYAVQTIYSQDAGRALAQVVFFYVPFALLFARLRTLEWTPRLVGTCFGVLVGLALIFAAIGYVEYTTRHLLFNPKVIASNQIEQYFRVNSLFFDPNIYGRFLALVMVGLAALLLWARRPAGVLAATAALAVLAGGLLLTLSQSSFAALLAGLAVVALLRWPARWTLAAAGLAAAAVAVLVLAFPQALGVDLRDRETLDRASSGRLELIDGGLRLAVARPVLGWGSGSFQREYRRLESTSGARATAASHTIPITVAAEQGLIGLALYCALLVAALGRLLRGASSTPARAAIAAAFTALVAHTWMYAAFLEDPVSWALLGVGSALAARSSSGREGGSEWRPGWLVPAGRFGSRPPSGATAVREDGAPKTPPNGATAARDAPVPAPPR